MRCVHFSVLNSEYLDMRSCEAIALKGLQKVSTLFENNCKCYRLRLEPQARPLPWAPAHRHQVAPAAASPVAPLKRYMLVARTHIHARLKIRRLYI